MTIYDWGIVVFIGSLVAAVVKLWWEDVREKRIQQALDAGFKKKGSHHAPFISKK